MFIGVIDIQCLFSGCTKPEKRATTLATSMPSQQAPATVADAVKLLDHRDDWNSLPPPSFPRYPAEKFLKGLTIVIDPGHGGTDGGNISTRPSIYKAGPRGEKEAFINLRVALVLERLLKDAGVNVIMTRHGDNTLSLVQRAEVANTAKRLDGGIGADLFVSVHHNASGPTSNYPSVWFHGAVDDNEPDIDVARFIAFQLGQQMRTKVGVTAPIFSSQLMYNSGFGVLRACKMPAVTPWSWFMTAPDEENRLRDGIYNLREAYGIYLGLCEWAYAGRPTQAIPVISAKNSGNMQVFTTLDEGLPTWWGSETNRIPASSVYLTLDGNPLVFKFDELSRTVTATLSVLTPGTKHVLIIHHANFLGNHNWPQRYELAVDDQGAVSALPLPSLRPAERSPNRPTTNLLK